MIVTGGSFQPAAVRKTSIKGIDELRVNQLRLIRPFRPGGFPSLTVGLLKGVLAENIRVNTACGLSGDDT